MIRLSVHNYQESCFFSAPSRNIDHARPWEDEDGISYKSSGPSYNGEHPYKRNELCFI